MSSQTLSFSQLINAPVKQVYRAFTNSTALRQWLCDVATVSPKPSGRLYLWWNTGYYTSGEYSAVEPDAKVVFSWFGRGEPGPTQVNVIFTDKNGATLIALEHRGIGEGPEWSKAGQEIKEGWQMGLENLKSVLETGEDQRFTLRPMLGITLSDFNPEIAEKLGVPVSQGIRLDGTIEGMGARGAGLQADDVIVVMNEHPITDFNSITVALHRRRAGDKVNVGFYRHSELRSTAMQLSRRPLPEIPWKPADLAEVVKGRYAEIQAQLGKFLESVKEAEASARPTPGEWSVKEILAHLIHSVRGYLNFLGDRVGGFEPHYDDNFGNLDAYVEATVAAYPTLDELTSEYRHAQTEMVEFIKRLPADFVKNKPAYWQTAHELLIDEYHFPTHLEQMRKAVEAVRAG